jgi:hypothetical protein
MKDGLTLDAEVVGILSESLALNICNGILVRIWERSDVWSCGMLYPVEWTWCKPLVAERIRRLLVIAPDLGSFQVAPAQTIGVG